MRTGIIASIFATSLVLSGCGVTFNASRVDPSEGLSGEGVVYSLPRTVLRLSQPMTLVNKGGGAFPNWEGCYQACTSGVKEAVRKELCKVDTSPALVPGRGEVTALSEADPGHRYRVMISPGLFETVSHKFVVDNDGILQETENSATNTTYEVVAGAVRAVVALAGGRTWNAQVAESAKSREKPGVTEARCLELQAELVKAFKKNATVTCDQARLIEACTAETQRLLGVSRTNRRTVLDNAQKSNAPAAVLKYLDARTSAEVAAAKAVAASDRANYGVAEQTSTPIPYVMSLPLVTPKEFKDEGSVTLSLGEELDAGRAVLTSSHEAAERNRPGVVELLRSYKVQASVAQKDDLVAALCAGTAAAACAGPADGGYRYRLPAQGIVTVEMKEGDKAIYRIRQEMPIAQYGLIAALPSKFRGKAGSINVKLNPATGGLQEVVLGAEALPTSTVTDVVDNVRERVEARRAADPELAALKREADIAELRKKIRDANNPAPPAPAE